MKQKKEKSPILVFMTIAFLAMFIVLPPVFRAVSPKQVVTESKKIILLSCEKISAVENYKITSKITYEKSKPVKNVINYLTYVASPGEGEFVGSGDVYVKTAAEEIALFRSFSDIKINENDTSISVTLKTENIENNSSNLELANYLQSNIDQQEMFYMSQGYSCEVLNL